jgi:exosortase K
MRALPSPVQAVAALLTLAAGYWLKRTYSQAGADELFWVLGPSCSVAARLGVELVREPGAGFISRSAHMVVGPACAGVNFLLASWLALYVCLQADRRAARLLHLLGLAGLSFAAAYLSTVAVNGVRIALAARLFQLDIYGSLLTTARAHRLLGVALYCSALLGLCLAGDRLRRGNLGQLQAARSIRTALAVYLGVALGIPLLNRAFLRDPGRFSEHALVTLAGAAGVVLLFSAAHRLCSLADRPNLGSHERTTVHGQTARVDRRRRARHPRHHPVCAGE